MRIQIDFCLDTCIKHSHATELHSVYSTTHTGEGGRLQWGDPWRKHALRTYVDPILSNEHVDFVSNTVS